MQTRWQTAAVLVLALLLTACGGGGGGGGGSSDSGSSNGGTNSPSSNPSSSPSTGNSNGSTSNPSTSNPSSPSSAIYRVQLTWTAPGTRANGTPLPLSELAGYRVYYLLEGSDPSSDSAVAVNGGSTTSLSLNLTAAGNYTFAITAIDQSGLESSLSAPVSVPIN